MGLLNRKPAPQEAKPQAAETKPAAQPADDTTKQLQRVMIAAKKIMYSDGTHPAFLKMLQGSPVQAAANAATQIMHIIVNETKGQINPKLVIPAGVAIVGDVVDFIEKTKGVDVKEDEIHQAVIMFIKNMVDAITPAQPASQPPAAQPAPGGM